MHADLQKRLIRVGLPVALVAGVAAAAGWVALRGVGAPRPAVFEPDSVPPVPLVTPEGGGAFVGSSTCAECHPSESAQHRQSLHARTLLPADAPEIRRLFATSQVLSDAGLGTRYWFAVRNAQPVASVEIQAESKTVELTPQFAIGSGKYGITFVYKRNGQFMESRTSFYPPLHRWDWTPGQENQAISSQPEGRPMPRDEAVQCFLCHGTRIVQTDTDPVAAPSIFNVGCERCHGPGRSHVEAARRGQNGGLHTYRRASGSTIIRLCGECHRRPVSSAAANVEDDPNLPRFAGTALAQSKCFQRSAGTLSCITCHNPHTQVSTDETDYERICRSCHAPTVKEHKSCPVNRASGCIPCHMPRQPIGFPGTKLHNHWIKPYLAAPEVPTRAR